MAKNALAEMSGDEVLLQLAAARNEHFNLRFQLATGQLTNYKRLGQLKRDVARALTRLRELEIAAAEAQEARS